MEVQRFGPLVVVATNDESPDPETFRSEIFTEKKEDRLRLIHRLGMDSIPALQELWAEFLKEHAGKEDWAITQFVGGGMLPFNIGEPGDKQIILYAGFDDATERPLQILGVFSLRNSRWTHVATLACRCRMSDREEPLRLRPYLPHPPGEWAITLWSHTEGYIDSRGREIRFRLRDGVLLPLIDFESRSSHCPDGVQPKANCLMSSSSLEKAKLVSEIGEMVSGFVVITYSGTVSTDVKVPILANARCASYSWSDEHFSYDPSPLKPAKCGLSDIPRAQPAKVHSKQNSENPGSR
jgi:hypothetical protein